MSSIPRWSDDESENNVEGAHGKQNDAKDLHQEAGDNSDTERDDLVDMVGVEVDVECADEAVDDRLHPTVVQPGACVLDRTQIQEGDNDVFNRTGVEAAVDGQFSDCADAVEGGRAGKDDTLPLNSTRAINNIVAGERVDYKNVPWRIAQTLIDWTHRHV